MSPKSGRKRLIALFVLAAACSNDEQASVTTMAASTISVESTTTTEASTTTDAQTTTTAASTTTDEATTTTAPDIELTGRAFVSTEVTGYELVPGSQVALSFQPEVIGGNGGCNDLTAQPWSIEGDVLVVGEVLSEEMGCEPSSLNDQDVWVGSLLASDPVVNFDGDTLTLTAGQSSITFVAQP